MRALLLFQTIIDNNLSIHGRIIQCNKMIFTDLKFDFSNLVEIEFNAEIEVFVLNSIFRI